MSTTKKPHKCNLCGIDDPSAFYPRRKSKCIKCLKITRQARYILEFEENQSLLGQTKICASCGVELPTSNFKPQNNNCKPCISKKEKFRRTQNYTLHMWKNAKYRAAKKGIEFSISPDDIRIPHSCPVLGIPLSIASSKGRLPNSPSLDRIDNSKGYTPSNIQVISWRANRIKADATPSELRKILAYIEGILLP